MAVIRRLVDTVSHQAEREPCRTEAQMEQVCCTSAAELPCCEVVSPWDGYSRERILAKNGIVVDENGRDAQGREVVVEFAARQHRCGSQLLEYDTSGHNCCQAVEPLADPFEDLVVGDDSSVLVTVDGGSGPYYWSVRAAGAWLDAGHAFRDGVTAGPAVRVFTGDVCGLIPVTVTDGCSSATIVVRAEDGQWVEVDEWVYDRDLDQVRNPPCIAGQAELVAGGSGEVYDQWEIIGGGERVWEHVDKNHLVLSVSVTTAMATEGQILAFCDELAQRAAEGAHPPCSGVVYPRDWSGCVPSACNHCSGENYFGKPAGSSFYYGYSPGVHTARRYVWQC